MRALIVVVGLVSLGAAPAPTLTAADVDQKLAVEWHKQHLQSGPLVDDAAFLRRVTVDLTGTIPTADAVRAFAADKRRDKRARAVDALLDSPAYALHWATYWDRTLMGRVAHGNVVDRVAFGRWLYAAFAKNRRWDQLAHELVTATGQNTLGGVKKNALGPLQEPEPDPEGRVHPAVNWILRYTQNPTDLTGKLSRIFLGVQIQCAQCHDHPSEKWKQDDFRSLAACFARTGPTPLEEKPKGIVRRVELRDQPGPTFGGTPDLRLIALAPPRALDRTDFSAADNRRVALADWMVRADNPWFARAIVNRYWAHLVGRGFVEPIDDFRRSNPPVAPALLDALAADFVAHKYDLKRLIRLVCATRVYQLAVVPGQPGEWDERLFTHHRMRPLSTEELYNALASATGFEKMIPNLDAIKTQIQNAFDFLFNIDEEAAPSADFNGSVQQALLFMNGKLVSGTVAAPLSPLGGILDFPVDDALKINALYLRTLARAPSPSESKRYVEYVNGPRDKRQAYEDLFWALLNSSEFLFQH
jgi:uncharacterized protein DUF1549/uncharacterized protein DUF1553